MTDYYSDDGVKLCADVDTVQQADGPRWLCDDLNRPRSLNDILIWQLIEVDVLVERTRAGNVGDLDCACESSSGAGWTAVGSATADASAHLFLEREGRGFPSDRQENGDFARQESFR